MKQALLLSGGMDSTAMAYWKRPSVAFTVDYGQRPAMAEIRASQAICDELNIPHQVIEIDLGPLGSGDLSNQPALSIAPVSEWWPFRNQMLISIAAMRAVALGIESLLIAAVRSDTVHADGTPEFVSAMNELLLLQEGGLGLQAPAISMTCAELVRVSQIPMEVLAWSHSCHVANHACGNCSGCRKHYLAMEELGFRAY